MPRVIFTELVEHEGLVLHERLSC